jgi:arrestin-related trafficking adapter 3/6
MPWFPESLLCFCFGRIPLTQDHAMNRHSRIYRDAGYSEYPTLRGQLFWIPAKNHVPPAEPEGYFHPRSENRPVSFYTNNFCFEPDQTKVLKPEKKRYRFRKLAWPRESAKRFLRALPITPAFPTQPNSTTTTAENQRATVRRSVGGGENMVFADNIIPGRSSAMVYAENRRAGRSSSVAEGGSRPSISIPGRQDRSASIASNQSDESVSILPVIRDEKPVASGNGVSVSISLAEPVLFLQGFDQNELSQRNTTMLRGSLHLKVTKPSKIKAISLNFKGKAETEWPEGKSKLFFSLFTIANLVNRSTSPTGRVQGC